MRAKQAVKRKASGSQNARQSVQSRAVQQAWERLRQAISAYAGARENAAWLSGARERDRGPVENDRLHQRENDYWRNAEEWREEIGKAVLAFARASRREERSK